MAESFDGLERLIISALHINPRASWGQVARAFGISEATVARRAQRLFTLGKVAVVGVIDHSAGEETLAVLARVACRPGFAERVSQALAREASVRFAAIVTGSAACLVEIVGANHDALLAALESRIGGIDGIVGVDTQIIMQTLLGTYKWAPATIPEEITAELRAGQHAGTIKRPSEAIVLSEQEQAVVERLRIDGRTSLVDLAEASGTSQSTVRRRIESLIERGILHFRLLVEPSLLGYGAEVMFWIQASPNSLTEVAESLMAHPDLRYLIATAGSTNLFGSAVLRTSTEMLDFATNVLGRSSAGTVAELQLVLRPVKRHWHIL